MRGAGDWKREPPPWEGPSVPAPELARAFRRVIRGWEGAGAAGVKGTPTPWPSGASRT